MSETESNDFPVMKVTAAIHDRSEFPAFYAGDPPLTYEVFMKSLSEVSIPHNHYVLVMVFRDFHNVFEYAYDARLFGLASSARTYNSSKQLLAEAKLLSDGLEVVEIEETHYNNAGQQQFRCKSEINTGTVSSRNVGEKRKESEVHGKKIRDYYFLWPVSLQP